MTFFFGENRPAINTHSHQGPSREGWGSGEPSSVPDPGGPSLGGECPGRGDSGPPRGRAAAAGLWGLHAAQARTPQAGGTWAVSGVAMPLMVEVKGRPQAVGEPAAQDGLNTLRGAGRGRPHSQGWGQGQGPGDSSRKWHDWTHTEPSGPGGTGFGAAPEGGLEGEAAAGGVWQTHCPHGAVRRALDRNPNPWGESGTPPQPGPALLSLTSSPGDA